MGCFCLNNVLTMREHKCINFFLLIFYMRTIPNPLKLIGD